MTKLNVRTGVRVVLISLAYIDLSSCVGAITHSTQTKISTEMCPEQGAGNLTPCSTGKPGSFSNEQVIALWGQPKIRGVKNGQDYFVYESDESAKHGVTLIVVVLPIPLDISAGHYDAILYFSKNRLVSTSQDSDNEQAGACGPLFMLEGQSASPCVH